MLKSIASLIATFFYSGYAPVAPGTAGSAATVLVLWFLPPPGGVLWAVIITVLFIVGVWAADTEEKRLGKEDPSIVVIDEVVGMIVAVFLIPKTILWWGAAFLLFRLFDITKPWPCRQLENMHGGWGIMLDDLGAGIYTCLLLHLAGVIWT
jgi:phosphatidylglycerophosphatase A